MDISTFGITGVASITVICFLLAEIIKPFVMGRKTGCLSTRWAVHRPV